jgi:hypothetical protein
MNRPTPDDVREIVGELGPNGEIVRIPEIVARIRMLAGCSRATAYRAVADAMAVGAIRRVRRENHPATSDAGPTIVSNPPLGRFELGVR